MLFDVTHKTQLKYNQKTAIIKMYLCNVDNYVVFNVVYMVEKLAEVYADIEEKLKRSNK